MSYLTPEPCKVENVYVWLWETWCKLCRGFAVFDKAPWLDWGRPAFLSQVDCINLSVSDFQSVVPGSAALASPCKNYKFWGSAPTPLNQKLCFHRPFWQFWQMLNFENHWSTPFPQRPVAVCEADYEWGTGNSQTFGEIIRYSIVIILDLGTPNLIMVCQSEWGFMQVKW